MMMQDREEHTYIIESIANNNNYIGSNEAIYVQ